MKHFKQTSSINCFTKATLFFILLHFPSFSATAKTIFQCPEKIYLQNITLSSSVIIPKNTRLLVIQDTPIWLNGVAVYDGPPEEKAQLKPENGDEPETSSLFWHNLHQNDLKQERSIYLSCEYGQAIQITLAVTNISNCQARVTPESDTRPKQAVFECQ